MKKAQVLVMVFFFLAATAVAAVSARVMFSGHLRIMSLRKYGLQAFYLAQSAGEKAKAEVLNDHWNAGTHFWPGPTDKEWSDDLDDPGDNLVFRYRYSVHTPLASSERAVVGQGQVSDRQGKVLACRRISFTVQGISDSFDNTAKSPLADGNDDDPADNRIRSWTWQEK